MISAVRGPDNSRFSSGSSVMRNCALIALIAVLGSPACGAEKWADPSLKLTNGLILWLDASRQTAAWQAHGKLVPPADALVDVLYDTSGQGLHLTQHVREAQPRLVRAGDQAVIRFDGKDDFLGLTGTSRKLERFTLFVHAPVRS